MEVNLINFLDNALDLIAPFTFTYDYEMNNRNIAEENAEAMLESTKIRSSINTLISNTLGFANVIFENDKKILTFYSQKVIRDCIKFEEECSIDKVNSKCNANNRRIAADVLENSLNRLETLINDSLLHLIFDVFSEIEKNPFLFFETIKNTATEDEIQIETDKFDLLNDRLIQIGLFAVSFADDIQSNLL